MAELELIKSSPLAMAGAGVVALLAIVLLLQRVVGLFAQGSAENLVVKLLRAEIERLSASNRELQKEVESLRKDNAMLHQEIYNLSKIVQEFRDSIERKTA